MPDSKFILKDSYVFLDKKNPPGSWMVFDVPKEDSYLSV